MLTQNHNEFLIYNTKNMLKTYLPDEFNNLVKSKEKEYGFISQANCKWIKYRNRNCKGMCLKLIY